MKPADEVMWNIEIDPILRSPVTAVVTLDRAPDWEVLRKRVEEATFLLPRLRQRVSEPWTPLGSPEWCEAEVDLDLHMRRMGVPEPGRSRELLDLAGSIGTEAFDLARPLWELTLVEGLADGSAALIQKFHHSIMDGQGAMAFARLLFDLPVGVDAAAAAGLAARPEPSAAPPPPNVVAQGVEVAGRLLDIPRRAVGATLEGVRHPAATVRDGQRLVRSIGRAVAPVPASSSPLLRGRSLGRRFDTMDLLLEDLRAAGHAAGGTVNDAFLAAVVGGLTAYHHEHGARIDELHLTMPVSVRVQSDEMEGNRFAPVRFTVPTDIDDPLERVARLGALARTWQHEPFLQHTDAIATVLARMPKPVSASLFGGMLKNVDAVATNVAGLTEPACLAGAELRRVYAFAPPMGAAVNISLVSHLDRACIGVVLDTRAVPDDECLMASLVRGFDEVIAIVDHHARRSG